MQEKKQIIKSLISKQYRLIYYIISICVILIGIFITGIVLAIKEKQVKIAKVEVTDAVIDQNIGGSAKDVTIRLINDKLSDFHIISRFGVSNVNDMQLYDPIVNFKYNQDQENYRGLTETMIIKDNDIYMPNNFFLKSQQSDNFLALSGESWILNSTDLVTHKPFKSIKNKIYSSGNDLYIKNNGEYIKNSGNAFMKKNQDSVNAGIMEYFKNENKSVLRNNVVIKGATLDISSNLCVLYFVDKASDNVVKDNTVNQQRSKNTNHSSDINEIFFYKDITFMTKKKATLKSDYAFFDTLNDISIFYNNVSIKEKEKIGYADFYVYDNLYEIGYIYDEFSILNTADHIVLDMMKGLLRNIQNYRPNDKKIIDKLNESIKVIKNKLYKNKEVRVFNPKDRKRSKFFID